MMVEQKTKNDSNNLEDTVRSLQEENAKLMQLLRSQGCLVDSLTTSDGKSNDSTNIIFQNSDLSSTSNTINTTNQVTHQQTTNHGPINQQNYSGQVIHGHQSNYNPNFNTVIQSSSQPFVQNNSNTLVQNNTNLIQPINLVNFNNVSLDSIQSFFATQNNLLLLPPTSSSSTTTTTTTTTTSSTSLTTNNTSNSLISDVEQQSHQVSIRPKPFLPHQEPIPSKSKTESYENLTRQISSSSNSETTNLLDNDLNHKQPRPIRPKPSSRSHSIQVYNSMTLNETKPIISNVLTPSPLINNTVVPQTANTSTVSILSPSTSFDDHHLDSSPQLLAAKPLETSTIKPSKPTKPRPRHRKSTSSAATATPPIPIAPSLGRPLAPAPLNVQRIVTSTKRSITTKKRPSKSLVQYHSESVLQQSLAPSPPIDPFAESISGLLQNFDQELIASNFLPHPTTVTTTNILSSETSIRTLDQIDLRQIVNTTIQQSETFSSLNDFPDSTMINPQGQDFTVDTEQITSLINEEEMRLVEMNFDENTFLKQFDFEDPTLKLNSHSDTNLFPSLLNSNRQHSTVNSDTSIHPVYPGSSLINNNVFTTVVPLAFHQQSSRSVPEEGVQLTARHIEPSQVATYESGKYQDILDELVTVTDQDVLTHAQATAETVNDQSVLSTDFTFALIEATNEIIKTTEIEAAEETASAFVDLQYFYPVEEEEDDEEEDEDEDEPLTNKVEEKDAEVQQATPIVQEDKTDLLPSTDSPKSDVDAAITDLSSILQIGQTHSTSPIKSPSNEIPPTIDYDSLLPPPPVMTDYSSRIETPSRPAARIIFEPIFSPENPSSPIRTTSDEMILDSGCLNSSRREKSSPIDDHQIEDLLNETSNHPYDLIDDPPVVTKVKTPEQPKEEAIVTEEPTKEQYSPIPSVKLKLNSIYLKEERKRTPPPVEPAREPIKIKIRTKLPPPVETAKVERPPSPLAVPKLKIRKPTKKVKRRKTSPSIDDQLDRETKRSLNTEYAGLTRFEQSLAQFYQQQQPQQQRSSSPAHPQIPPTPGENDDSNVHNDESHPINSLTNENHSSPMSLTQNSTKKFSHLFNCNDEQLTKTTFITPPPDIDSNVQHEQKTSDDHYQNTKKIKKHHHSQATNSSISKQQNLSSSRKVHQESPLLLSNQSVAAVPPPPPPALHMNPYAQSYHHQFNGAASNASFFHFPFSNPYLNPHSTATPTHFHPNAMRYHHPMHSYPAHQQSFNYHPHLQQQHHPHPYMSSRDHHPFNR